MKIEVARESTIITGNVLDVSRAPLLAALRRYDPQLYLKWNSKKRGGRGVWELRRKPEFKSVREGRFLDTPKRGRVFFPGDVYSFDEFTISVPKYHETEMENHVKDFDVLGYHILDFVAPHDTWKYGYRGKDTMREAEYNEAKYDEAIEDEMVKDLNYMIKQNRTQFADFRRYVSEGGNPYRIFDYWK